MSCDATTTNPVIIATGEKVKPETDFIAQGLYAIELTRTYRSKNSTSNVFGPNWPSSFDAIRLLYSTQSCRMIDNVCYPLSATATEPNGAQYKYSLIGGTEEYRVYGSASKGTLYYMGAGAWELVRGDTTFTFNSAGRVTSKTVGGATLTYTYVSGKLTNVQNLVGQNVTLTYTGSRVTSIADPGGNTWAYTYNANGMLETVTSPGSSPDIRRYHYEVASAPTLLTGISINNVRYSTYSYLADKRVQESGLAGGEERDTFVYGTNQTTVTSAAGQPITYSFTTINGAMMPSAVSRAGTATCAASASQTVYDPNGYLDYQLDWKGNKTDYTYVADGKLMNVTSAAGTAAAKSRYFTWAGDD